MAIAYARPQVISRATGRSVVACAAYRAAEKLHDDRQDKTHRYEGRSGVLSTGILTPQDAPDWMRDREQLWNAVERREDRSNRPAEAQLAREVVIALPHELDDQSREYLLKNILKEGATRKGMVADYAIHAPDREGDNRNYHAHVLLTMRTVNPADPDGFGKKAREWNDKTELAAFKQIIERETNKMLERHGVTARISFDAAGRETQNHLGHHAKELERRGIVTEAGEFNRDVQARNDDRAALTQKREQIERQLTTLDRAERAATMSDAPRDIVTGITEAFGKNLERGELGERFNDYLKEQGLQLERDKAGNLHVSDGQKSVLLETIITNKDKREVLPVLEQPVTLALIPERQEPEKIQRDPETIKQERLREQARAAQDIGKAWHTADRDPLQFAINLGDVGFTLATNFQGNFVAVDDKGRMNYLNTATMGEDSRKVESALRETFRQNSVSLPTVTEIRQGIDDNRRADWLAARAAERRAMFEEKQATRIDDRAERLSKIEIVREIGRAWERSDSGPAFVKALEEQNVLLARVSRAEALVSQHQHEAQKSYGNFAPGYEAGQYVAVTKQGHVYALDMATLNDRAENIAAKLKQIEPRQQVTLTQAKEVMTFWREVERQQRQHPQFDLKDTVRTASRATLTTLGRAGHIGGIATRLGEGAFNGLGGVLDYLFGGLAAPNHPRRIVREDPQVMLRKTDRQTLLSDPNIPHVMQGNQGKADADLLAELRRQIEERRRRDQGRDR